MKEKIFLLVTIIFKTFVHEYKSNRILKQAAKYEINISEIVTSYRVFVGAQDSQREFNKIALSIVDVSCAAKEKKLPHIRY